MQWPKKIGAAIVLGTAIATAAVASNDSQTRTIQGTWQGAQIIDGNPHCWVETYFADGRFKADFVNFEGANWMRYVEEGRWLLGNQQLTVVTETVNGRDASLVAPGEEIDRYRVVKIDDKAMELIEQDSNITFKAKRVAAGTQVPHHCKP